MPDSMRQNSERLGREQTENSGGFKAVIQILNEI